MERRVFLKNAAGVASLLLPSALLLGSTHSEKLKIPFHQTGSLSKVKNPLAIAMWDFSWILRHHRYGEFNDWDMVLEELAERGYNAIRMDAMPQFVASGKDGKIIEEFRSPKKGWTPCLWGNDYTMDFRPREALLEFLPKCKKYGIQVGLATWFLPHGIQRDIFKEEGGLLRAWTETLEFLKKDNLLDNIIFVDLLNEYPKWHGYDWLKTELNKRSNARQFILNNPTAYLPDVFAPEKKDNRLFIAFYNDFAKNLIISLKQRFPNLDFYTSFPSTVALENIDFKNHAALDYHIWFNNYEDFKEIVKAAGSVNMDRDLQVNFKQLLSFWKEHKNKMINWMDGRITAIAAKAKQNGIVCGNTEGWGPISWYDHPDLSWNWVKESAEICIDLVKEHDEYKFICTSNFTHPHHKGMWEDIKWHRKITQIIKS